MLKIILGFILLILLNISFSQDSNYAFQYQFKITGIEEYGEAKLKIEDVRDLMGVKVVKFDDITNRYIVLTHLDFDIIELIEKFGANGIDIDGEIVKTIFE